jgi:hypothetical protein
LPTRSTTPSARSSNERAGADGEAMIPLDDACPTQVPGNPAPRHGDGGATMAAAVIVS